MNALSSQQQFAQHAAAYATSTRHVLGATGVVAYATPGPNDVAVDIATGAGHTAHALARDCRYVLATDITAAMLNQTRRIATEQGLSNVGLSFALAEALPIAEASVDIVTCRVSAHHFHDVPAFCREMRRVLKPNGRAVINDTVSPEDEEAHAFVNEVETLRDPSHIDDLKVSTWRQYLEEAGFEVVRAEMEEVISEHEIVEWTERAGTSAANVAQIRQRLATAPPHVAEALKLRPQGDTYVWVWPSATILARPKQ
jgi:ubiquinone/menaquinone biosynthesis C-methylase UbiE